MLQDDGSFRTDKFEGIINKLNSAPNFQLFEVGPKGVLLGGDIALSKGPEDEFEAVIKNVKPGIWSITEQPREDPMNFVGVLIRWVAPGPLDWDNIPNALPEPNLTPLSEWRRVGGYSVDSGTHGLLDKEALDELIESHGEKDRECALETLMDYALDDKLAVKVGFTLCGDDGGYSIMARTLEGVKVEILVKPYEEEDGDDDEGADVEEEDDADEE